MRLFRIVFIAIIAACQPSHYQEFNAPKFQQELNQFAQQLTKKLPVPGLALGVVYNGELISAVSGFSNDATRHKIDKETLFFTGNFSEVPVAEEIFNLEQKGLLVSGNPVKDYLPYFKTEGEFHKVTVGHLLTHSSGIQSFGPAWDLPAFDAGALERTTRSIIYLPLKFPPGTKVLRSAYNIDIAGDLMSKLTGVSFESHMNALLASKDYYGTFFIDSTIWIDSVSIYNIARPHELQDPLSYKQTPMSIYPYTRENSASFGFHASISSMLMYLDHLLVKKDSKVFKKVYQTQEGVYKGYGWEIFDKNGTSEYYNSWQNHGFSGVVKMVPKKDFGLVVLTNTQEDFDVRPIAMQLEKLMEGKPTEVNIPSHIALGRLISQGKTLDEVLEIYQSDTDVDFIKSPESLCQLGVNLLHRMDKPDEAKKVYQLARNLYPNSIEPYLNLMELALIQNQIQEAREYLNDLEKVKISDKNNQFLAYLEARLLDAEEMACLSEEEIKLEQ